MQREGVTGISEAHTAAVYNKMIKTQHEILMSEVRKIQHLNELIEEARRKREMEHAEKIGYYQQTQVLLEEELKRKDELMRRLGVIGLGKYER